MDRAAHPSLPGKSAQESGRVKGLSRWMYANILTLSNYLYCCPNACYPSCVHLIRKPWICLLYLFSVAAVVADVCCPSLPWTNGGPKGSPGESIGPLMSQMGASRGPMPVHRLIISASSLCRGQMVKRLKEEGGQQMHAGTAYHAEQMVLESQPMFMMCLFFTKQGRSSPVQVPGI